VVRGKRASPVVEMFKQAHETMLTRPPVTTNADQMLDIARGMTAFHEFLVAPWRRRAAEVTVSDPVYAALAGLAASDDVNSISDVFVQRVGDLLPGDRLPAAAGLVALVADIWPNNVHIGRLAAEIIAASEGREAQRVVTLLQLARSPVLGNLVDPVGLLSEAQHLPDDPYARLERVETMTGLFPVLVGLRSPAIALRLLHDCVREDWSTAMALLEHAARPLVETLGVNIADRLLDAIQRALACMSPDDTPPAEIDGVRVSQDR